MTRSCPALEGGWLGGPIKLMAHELGAAAAFPRLGLVARRKSREGGEARYACLAFPPLPWYTWVAPRGGREPLGLNWGGSTYDQQAEHKCSAP